ncbi:MAG: hypothetical protein RLZZ453_45 [Chlamydiota bacterium]
MHTYLFPAHYDLVTPDGAISDIQPLSSTQIRATVLIQNISPAFVGFSIDPSHISFNLKSTLAQLGLDAALEHLELNSGKRSACLTVLLTAYGEIGTALLQGLSLHTFIGKLFAADPKRKVRDPDYLLRMFGRTDRSGSPLLSLGGPKGKDELLLEKKEGKTVAFLQLQKGILSYDKAATLGLLPTLQKALTKPQFRVRSLIQLNQYADIKQKRVVSLDDMLLVHTSPLHIRTAFGKVVDEFLPLGVKHTAANVLEPDTSASGDVYELFGQCPDDISLIPVEFYTLEPHREYVFFSDRDQLQSCLEDRQVLFDVFQSSPEPFDHKAATFVVKGDQLLNLKKHDWICQKTHMTEFPGLFYPEQQALLVQRYIQQQPEYPFLKAMEDGLITSQGILLCRYFPSPVMKQLLLSNLVQKCLKRLYFYQPSLAYGNFFSHEDRSMLLDLAKFGIPTYWVDRASNQILRYTIKPGKDAGMFVPESMIETFVKSTAFGIYGSSLLHSGFEEELTTLLLGILAIKQEVFHPLLNPDTPVALVTGGGPGLMEVGNRVAKRIGILSCANVVDFRNSANLNIQEQTQNPHIEAKMTYRLDKLVERQSEFNLDFPIILPGGYGTDFEQCLEEVRRKVGSVAPTPVLLFGPPSFWREKITPRFLSNEKAGTIKGATWVSNCFFCIQNAEQGLKVYKQFFSHTLPIGPNHPADPNGFITVD